MNKEKVNTEMLVPGIFVLVEMEKDYFEIGISREYDLNGTTKELKILLLTDSEFKELPPKFDPEWLPFLDVITSYVGPKDHNLYSLDPAIVHQLLAEQKKFLESQKDQAEKSYTHAIDQHAPEVSSKTEFALNAAVNLRGFTSKALDDFNRLAARINELSSVVLTKS